MKHLSCNICGSNQTKVIQKAEAPLNVVKCQECNFVYVSPQPDLDMLCRHYDEQDYYEDWIKKQMPKRILMWKERFKDLRQYRPSGRLLDVGCGIGTFLNIAKSGGFDVQGTEISGYASKYAQEKYGFPVFKGTLEGAGFDSESFDVVTIWHVLEHVSNPKSTIAEIYRLLKPNGLLVIAVPNVDNFLMQTLYRLVKRKELKYFSIEDKELHLYHFSEKTLRVVLESAGFSIVRAGIDVNAVQLSKQIIDLLSVGIYALTRKNFGNAIKIFSVKK